MLDGWLPSGGFPVVGAAVFPVLVPRLMGPAVYGRDALLTSVSMWFPGNLLLALVHRSGETLVRLSTGDYVEVVGFYGAASNIYLTAVGRLLRPDRQVVVTLRDGTPWTRYRRRVRCTIRPPSTDARVTK